MYILSCLIPDIRKLAGYIIIFNINKGIKGISETFLGLPPMGDTNLSLGVTHCSCHGANATSARRRKKRYSGKL